MADLSNRWTEEQLRELEEELYDMFAEAYDELGDTIAEYFRKFERRDAEMKALLNAGEITEQEYRDWRLSQIGRGKHFKALQDEVAQRMTNINEVAMTYINEVTPNIYALNYNFEQYKNFVVYGGAFEALPETAIRRLAVEKPEIMPFFPEERAIERGIDLAYGKRQISAHVTSGIIRGLPIGKIADELQMDLTSMERSSAVRAARTAVTGAQNGGRMDSYHAAQKMGIKLQKEWLATLDRRTRHAHAILDGQVRDVDEAFEVEGKKIMYPGDMNAAPGLVYNCRCTLIAKVDGVDTSDTPRKTYSEWLAAQEKKNPVEYNSVRGIIQDRNMAAGFRQPPTRNVGKEEQECIKEIADEIGIPRSVLVFNVGNCTGFSDLDGTIHIRGDIFPDATSRIARDRMSERAVLAHEYYGHFMNDPSEYDIGDWRDEYRASRNAAINAPNLTKEDRALLMIDAYDRARDAGQIIPYDEEANKIIYGY